jgi:hypothetical protein
LFLLTYSDKDFLPKLQAPSVIDLLSLSRTQNYYSKLNLHHFALIIPEQEPQPKLNNLHQGKPAEMQEVWEKNNNHGIEAFVNHLCGRGKKNYNGKENCHTLECTSILHLTELEKTKLSDLS